MNRHQQYEKNSLQLQSSLMCVYSAIIYLNILISIYHSSFVFCFKINSLHILNCWRSWTLSAVSQPWVRWCFSLYEVLPCCHLPDKPLFILQCSLQGPPPPWSASWLPLIHGLFCPLSWVSLVALTSNLFLFSHSQCTSGHQCWVGVLFASHYTR